MSAIATTSLHLRTLELLNGSHRSDGWVRRSGARSFVEPIALLCLAAAAYGAAMGAWRDPRLAFYAAIKMPILFLATAWINALVNSLWAARFGLQLTFAESLRAVLTAFMLTAIVLAALAPVLLYFAVTLPRHDETSARLAHDGLGLAHIVAIALAGSVATARQMRLVDDAAAVTTRARALVIVWLAVNLLVGAQISWNLRPWFGTPDMAVEFLRAHPFDGTFYESFVKIILHN